jgi:hypothetical protein
MSPTEQVLGVARLGSGALTNHVIEILVPYRDVIVSPELPLQIVQNRPLWSLVSESGVAAAESSIVVRLGVNGDDWRQV